MTQTGEFDHTDRKRRLHAERACARAEPFGALPACSRSVSVRAQSAASALCSSSSTTTTTGQSASPLPVRGHGQRNAVPAGLSDGKSPLAPEPRSPRPPLRLPFCGDGCALSSRSRLRPAPVAEAAAPPLLACLRVGPGYGGAAGRGSVGSFTGDDALTDGYRINAILCASRAAGRTVRHLA